MTGFSGLGSMPGTDMSLAADVVGGESTDGEVLIPLLPARGLGADAVGRTGVVLQDVVLDRGPRSWRIADHPSRVTWQARDLLTRDLDVCEELWNGAAETIRFSVVGPWSLGASVELPSGHRMLTDHGSVRFLAESLSAGLDRLLDDLDRRFSGARYTVQIDEHLLPDVHLGRVPDAVGTRFLHPVGHRELSDMWRRITEPLAARGVRVVLRPGGKVSELSMSAVRDSGVDALAVRADAVVGSTALDTVGVLIAEGIDLDLGVVSSVPDRGIDEHTGAWITPDERTAAKRAARLWDELSFPRIDMIERMNLSPMSGFGHSPMDWPAAALRSGRLAADLVNRAAGDL